MSTRRATAEISRAPTAERDVRKVPFGAPHVYVLAIVDGEAVETAYRLKSTETTLGRGPDADFFVDDSEVSKRHLVFHVDGSVCTVADAGSLNGSTINGRELRKGIVQRLRHLDEIEIGGTRLLFLRGRFRQIDSRA